MSDSEKYLAQAETWMASADDNFDTQLCIDLPEINWITIRSVAVDDGIAFCEYRNMSDALPPHTIMFPIEKITAARRSKSAKSYLT